MGNRALPPENGAKRQSASLRRRAEERVAKHRKSVAALSAGDTRRLVHELEVHQVELELQNEELRQARAELEANYNELYDFAPVGYFTLSGYGDIEKINLTGAGMLGEPRTRLLGQRLASFVRLESLPHFNECLRRAMGGSEKESCMATLMKGGDTPVAAYMEAIGAGSGSSCRVVAVDITSAEQARLALQDSLAHLKLALAASDMGVWEWERESGDVYWSLECIKISGVDKFSPKLDTVARLLHPADAQRVRSVFSQALADGKERSVECRIIRPSGEIAWIYARGQVQYDQHGNPSRLFGIVQDITERRRRGAKRKAEPA